jgi:uncharacterized membrane protein
MKDKPGFYRRILLAVLMMLSVFAGFYACATTSGMGGKSGADGGTMGEGGSWFNLFGPEFRFGTNEIIGALIVLLVVIGLIIIIRKIISAKK